MIITKPEFFKKFDTTKHINKLCYYFELLYNNYQSSWTDKLLLQAKMDALVKAGFTFDRHYRVSDDEKIDLMILEDAERLKVLDNFFGPQESNIMVWWIHEHMGSAWLKYIRGMDLFLNSMRMVGEAVVNPVEKSDDGKLEEVVDTKLWIDKLNIYSKADLLEERLSHQKRALFVGMEMEGKFLDIVLSNSGDSSDLDVGKWLRAEKQKTQE